ncbi:MAG TPA: 3-ketoacyl-ACP reductase [Bacteroidota bacterium]|nr:3-ketoacyl-ACP reductase [Bacteroidota bacterium]
MSSPVILITGASRGLGRGIAIHCARAGYSVAINYAGNRAAAEEAASLCEEQKISDDQRFIPIRASIALPEERTHLVEQTLKAFGRIDALVNNAGIGAIVRADVTTTSEENFDTVIKTNLYGPHFITQAVVNHWLSTLPIPLLPAGLSVIFVTSISADTASVNRGEYCISKAALSMSAQLWATRLAPEKILVMELRPGIMATDMTASVTEQYDRMLAEGVVPQSRWGTADDVGMAAVSILNNNFPFSAGSVIHIDGGFHLKRL